MLHQVLPSRASRRSVLARGIALLVALLAGFGSPRLAAAQPVIGHCDIHTFRQRVLIRADMFVFTPGVPGNGAYGARDASGQTYMLLPPPAPGIQFWLTWDGGLVEVLQQTGQWRRVGDCQVSVPARPVYQSPSLSYGRMRIDGGGQSAPVDVGRVPSAAFDAAAPGAEVQAFLPPLIPTQALTTDCMTRAGGSAGVGNRNRFLDCVAEGAMAPKELASYRCMRTESGKDALALCLLRENMGQAERGALEDAQRCYRQHGTRWTQYSLCMASDRFDPKTAQAVQCLQQSTATGSMNYWALAGCVAGPRMGLNYESAVAMECAMASGGEPMAFVTCTGGQLAATELQKCLTDGVGDSGCFGKNNFFTQQINAVGQAIGSQFGPNSVAAKTWSDITKGPGPNHEAVKLANNVAREVDQASKNVTREIAKVMPRVTIKW